MLGGWGTRPGRSWGWWGCGDGPSASRGPGGLHGLSPSPSLPSYPSGSRENAGPHPASSSDGGAEGARHGFPGFVTPSRASGGGVTRQGHSLCLRDAPAWPTCSVGCGAVLWLDDLCGFWQVLGVLCEAVEGPAHTPISICVSLTTLRPVWAPRGATTVSPRHRQLFPLLLLLGLGLRATRFSFDAIIFTHLPFQDFVNRRGSFKKSSPFWS